MNITTSKGIVNMLKMHCPALYEIALQENYDVNKLRGIQPYQNDNCLETKCSQLWNWYMKNKKDNPYLSSCNKFYILKTDIERGVDCKTPNLIDTELFNGREPYQFHYHDLNNQFKRIHIHESHDSSETMDWVVNRLYPKKKLVILKVVLEADCICRSFRANNDMRLLMYENPILTNSFVTLYDVQVNEDKNALYILQESLDQHVVEWYHKDRGLTTNRQVQNMLIQSFLGLKKLYDLGYQHNNIDSTNFMIRKDTMQFKFINYNMFQSIKSQKKNDRKFGDLFSYGKIVYQILFGKNIFECDSFILEEYYESGCQDKNILKLCNVDNEFQYIAKCAYHFLTRNVDEQWSYNQAYQYLQNENVL